MHSFKRLVLFLFTLFQATHSFALVDDLRWTHFGVRPLSMGNAFVAVADDYNALFYNPAGLARLHTWHGEFLNPAFETSLTTYRFLNSLSTLLGKGFTDILSTLKAQSGKTHRVALYETPHLVFKNFGFGLGLQFSAELVTQRDINVGVQIGPSVILPISFATNLFEDRLSIGASAKVVMKAGIDQTLSLDTLSALSKSSGSSSGTKLSDLIQAGYGVGLDAGLLFTPIKTMSPTLGLSVTDIGGTPYKKENIGGTAVSAPPTRLPSVNTGISLKPWQADRMYVLIAADSHMINQPVHYSHKINLGLEWGYSEIIKVDAGLKEGYLTGGFQFDVGLLKLRLATYVVDYNPVVGLLDDLTERRVVLQFKLLI